MTTPATTIASAKPLTSLTPEQKRARYEELRKRIGASKLEVRGLPGIHYTWGHTQDNAEMVRLETLGYSIVREPNAKAVIRGETKPAIQANGLRQDGTYVIGDVILIQCSQEDYEFIMLDAVQRGEEQVRTATDEFCLEAEKAGVPVFRTDEKGKRKE